MRNAILKTKITVNQFKKAGLFISAHVVVVGFIIGLAIAMATGGIG